MKYEIYFNESDNAYCLIGEGQAEKQYKFLTQDSIKINEITENSEDEARDKYDEIISRHQKQLNK